MTMASNQPSLPLADEVESLVVKNAQPKRVDGRSVKDPVRQKNIQRRENSLSLPKPDQKGHIQGSLNRVPAHRGLGFPYKASIPEIKPKTRSIPDAQTMRADIDAFVRGDSTVLRGYDAR
jgi:hypothetical protein